MLEQSLEALSTTESTHSAFLSGPYGTPYEFRVSRALKPTENEALVRIDYSGVCHGDVYTRDGGGPAPLKPRRPLTGGHEGVGEIVSLGALTSTSPCFSAGDRVGIAWRSQTCGQCDACRCGAENHCPSQEVVGMDRDGTFQRFVLFPISELIRIPVGLDGASACPILCAGVTSYVALRKMHPEPGKWCVISGAAGGVGHLAIQYAKKVFGLKVLAVDAGSKEKERFCREMGCDQYVDFLQEGEQLASSIVAKTGGGADYVVLLSPHQSAYNAAGEYARFRAQIMAVGIGSCSMPLRPILKKDLTIRSTETGKKRDIEEALCLTAKGVVTGRVQMMELGNLNQALDRVKSGSVMGKLVLDLRHNGRALSLVNDEVPVLRLSPVL